MGVIATYYAKAAKARRARKRRRLAGGQKASIGSQVRETFRRQSERKAKEQTQTLMEDEANQSSDEEEKA